MSGMSRNTVGHSGKCTVCQLCLKSNAKIKHLNQMNVQPQFKEAYTWLKEHQPTINDSACICLPCVKQIQRNHSKEFTPRWLPKPPVPLKLCNLEHCKCIVYAQTTLVTVDELEKCLKQKVNAFTVTSDQSNSIGLCRQHYMLMYNTLHAAPCDSCLAKPKKGETFNRHCSSPEVVNEYLSHVSAENSQLTSASTVCLTCYKYFKSIIAEVTGKGKPLVPTVSLGTILAKLMITMVSKFSLLCDDAELETFRSEIQMAISSTGLCFDDFHTFMKQLSQKQDTIHFWYQFVTVDIMAYFSLFIAIRYRNWDLRNCSIKLLAPVFSAFDRPIYQSLIPRHISDVLSLPDCVHKHLQRGSFCVRLSASEWHGVALDECHEMKINKDAKMAVTRPSVHKMEHLSNHLPFRAACVNNLTQQLFPERDKRTLKFSHSPTSKDKKTSLNVERMLEAISNHGLFHSAEENNGLSNFLQSQKASSEQAHDLLKFREIGQTGYEAFILSKLLNIPSTAAPVRRKRLNTFTTSQAERRRVKQVDKEAKISQRYLKKTVVWLAEHGGEGADLNTYTWLKEHQPTINDSACICLPCVKQIQRNHSKEFTPRWLPKPPVPLKLCNLEHCKCIVYAQTTLVTVDELEKCLKQKVNAFTVTSDQSNSIGLCRQHYMLMYNTLHAAPCDSCLAKPKKGETFNRHCSSPEVVNEYLSHVSAENSQLTSASTVCLTCYKYFKSIIAEVTGKGKPLVPTVSLGTILAKLMITMVSKFSLLCDDAELETFRSEIQMAISSTGLCFDDFHTFMKQLSQKQDTIHFWYQFVTVDIMAYFSLFIAIRYRNWDLRNCSIKLLAPVFSAFDRPIYQSLIPRHISDVLSLPDCVHKHLQRGSFCVRLSASEWHGVALDECHEMKINKDAKMAVTRPSVHKMEHLSNHLPFRAACVNNLTQQLFPERDKRTLKFSHSPTSKDKKTSLNVERMLEAISNHGLFHSAEENNGLSNFLQSQKASSEQAHDLLKFREIGQTGYEAFILSKLLNIPSTAAPVRRKRLNTFTTSQAERRRVKQVDKEAKISQRYLKKTVVWLAEHGGEGADLNTLLGPPSPTPRALMDNDGLPYKGTKSSTTAYLERRYTNPPVIINSLPTGWIPHSVILEGMFLIQMSPLPSMNCMEEYVKLLLSRYVRPHFYAGVIEVHVVFDVAGLQRETPKEIEQMRRDGTMNNASTRHHCIDFCSDLLVPEKWRTVLGCRKCKKSLTSYIADDMLRLICNDRSFRSHQTFIANIGGQAYATIGQSRQLRTDLSTNADEADLRVWLHCQRACGVHKLLYSPDTDVYHIGLSIVGGLQECDVIIQLSKYTDDRARYLHMTNMITALTKDPDLSEIHIQTRPQVLQSIYVATGCDYTSFFNGLGKVTFLATFFQHAAFIAGRNSPPGTIGEMSLDLQSNAKFSFLRLIGCAYYKQHTSGFRSQTPEALFYSVSDAATTSDHHAKWLAMIRSTVRQRVDTESKSMPTTEALLLHWNRCMWIVAMWHSATLNSIDLPGMLGHYNVHTCICNTVIIHLFCFAALTDYGWKRENGVLEIVWEVSENIAKSKSSLEFFLSGCKCKTGCSTRICSCKKKDRKCGPSCSCHFCKNTINPQKETCTSETDLLVQDLLEEHSDDTYVEESDDDLEDLRNEEMDNDQELQELMDYVFGPETDDEDYS